MSKYWMMAFTKQKNLYTENAITKAGRIGGEPGDGIVEPESKPIQASSPEQNYLEFDEICDRRDLDDGELAEDEYIENKAIGHYQIIRKLGSGSSGQVVLAYDRKTKERVAVKIVKRKSGATTGEEPDKRVYREVVISTLMNHPNIVRQLDFLYSDSYFFLVFEYVKGMQLYDKVLKETYIKEDAARRYFRQIVSAIDYMHRNCICHRDLKIENIMIDQNDNIKIIDFGLANFYDNKILLSTFCGSLYFAAPELLLAKHYMGPEVDVWSLGIVLYVMLCGRVPFDDESVCVLQGKIKNTKFDFCRAISSSARDLIIGMLLLSNERLGLEEIKKSEWLNINHENIVHNYMLVRQPIHKLNMECVQALKAALSFQFEDVEADLRSYVDLCHEDLGSLEGIYWTKRPVVSLYYLLVEDYCVRPGQSCTGFPTTDIDEDVYRSSIFSRKNSMASILHNFVRFVLAGSHDELYKRYFIKSIFKYSPAVKAKIEASVIWPCIRKSYIKGFFKGIKVRNIGSHNALKKTMIDIFRRLDIIYEANEKSYFCSYFDNDNECFFKISLYYNVILAEYYLVLKLLNSKTDSFQQVFGIIQASLKERTSTAANLSPKTGGCVSA